MSVEILNKPPPQRAMRNAQLSSKVSVRRFPYPYKAMLALCSDLDETPNANAYVEQMRFLNTRHMTSMGEGVGLEVGNTIYFDMPPDQFAYWNTDDAGREMARTLIRSGHIDCLHSFGDLANTRAHAARALDELARHDLQLKVWIDHAVAPTNFGADIMQGHGDEAGHPAYHADLTISHGVRYVWRGRVTSVIGQNKPSSLRGVGRVTHPLASTRTLAKEVVKQVVGRCGQPKYAFHARNETLGTATLRDGQPVIEFLRCNPHFGGVSSCDTGDGLGQVLTEDFLKRLVEREGTCVLYTHLGKTADRTGKFAPQTIAALRLLARFYREGQILVTTTRRLLDFEWMRRSVACHAVGDTAGTHISITPGVAGLDFQGLTVEGSVARALRIETSNGDSPAREIRHIQETGRVSVPWEPLAFPGI